VQIGAIQLSDRGLGRVRFRHFDERETARLARVPVSHDIHALHTAVSSEYRMKIILGSLITEISDKYVCHNMNSFLVDLSLSVCFRTNLLEGNVAAGRHSKHDTDAGKDTFSIYQFRNVRGFSRSEARCPASRSLEADPAYRPNHKGRITLDGLRYTHVWLILLISAFFVIVALAIWLGLRMRRRPKNVRYSFEDDAAGPLNLKEED